MELVITMRWWSWETGGRKMRWGGTNGQFINPVSTEQLAMSGGARGMEHGRTVQRHQRSEEKGNTEDKEK
ncbi:hypothetical protein TELCIR_15296 [Teladorsagia circumcincta]|uniref:Uncharacterized protein n=1 Tax=Teladorsagia circumcincta TaxID=45464 RepID=A0A2G9TYJ2_TELCI|nr:hypothetical protein TELCIR_15296 [Teladorsagia circumcincta]